MEGAAVLRDARARTTTVSAYALGGQLGAGSNGCVFAAVPIVGSVGTAPGGGGGEADGAATLPGGGEAVVAKVMGPRPESEASAPVEVAATIMAGGGPHASHPGVVRVVDSGKLRLPDGRIGSFSIILPRAATGDMMTFCNTLYFTNGLMTRASARSGGGVFTTQLEAAAISFQVLGALAYAHEHGVAHRDVKLENMLADGVAVLRADVADTAPPALALADGHGYLVTRSDGVRVPSALTVNPGALMGLWDESEPLPAGTSLPGDRAVVVNALHKTPVAGDDGMERIALRRMALERAAAAATAEAEATPGERHTICVPRVLLSDWGSAAVSGIDDVVVEEAEDGREVLMAPPRLGTFQYMAPEVMVALRSRTVRYDAFAADVFAAGCTLGILVVGKRLIDHPGLRVSDHTAFTHAQRAVEGAIRALTHPYEFFVHASHAATMPRAVWAAREAWRRACHARGVAVATAPAHVPEAALRFICRMLAPAPADRPTAADMLSDPWLVGWLAPRTVAAAPAAQGAVDMEVDDDAAAEAAHADADAGAETEDEDEGDSDSDGEGEARASAAAAAAAPARGEPVLITLTEPEGETAAAAAAAAAVPAACGAGRAEWYGDEATSVGVGAKRRRAEMAGGSPPEHVHVVLE